MPTSGMNIIFQDATGATAVRSYSDMIIIGEDGHKVETFTPRGVANASPVANVTIDGISQFDGLTNGVKVLTISGTGTSAVWDGGTAVTIATSTSYTLYDSDDNNFVLVTIGGVAPVDGDYNITVQNGVLADAITVIEMGDELLTASPVITDAGSASCSAAGTYPRPTSTHNYAVNAADYTLIAIKNTVSPGTVVDISIDYSVYNKPRAYTSQNAVEVDHKADTEIAKASAKMFANGAGTVSVMNTWDGDSKEYATCLTTLVTENYDYDIMVPVVDVEDANFILCAAHAVTYSKVIIAPKIGTATAVRAAMGTLTLDECQYGICYDTTTYTVAELAGAAAAVIAQKSPWIPCEWGSVAGINAAGYTKDDVAILEGSATTLRVNTYIAIGTYIVLSSGKALKAGTWLDIPRTKQYLENAVKDAWTTAKLILANSNQKVPYTQEGINTIGAIIRKPLKRAQKAGALREDSYNSMGVLMPGFVVTLPLIEDIPLAYISNRQLPDVFITAYLSGAVSTIDPVYFTVALGEV